MTRQHFALQQKDRTMATFDTLQDDELAREQDRWSPGLDTTETDGQTAVPIAPGVPGEPAQIGVLTEGATDGDALHQAGGPTTSALGETAPAHDAPEVNDLVAVEIPGDSPDENGPTHAGEQTEAVEDSNSLDGLSQLGADTAHAAAGDGSSPVATVASDGLHTLGGVIG